jgi:uncharacterized membrane protein YeiH
MDLTLLSLFGTAVFAASGALAADQDGFDIVGAIFLSVAAAIGGGTIVDLLIGQTPVRWVETPTPLWVAAASGVAVFLAVRFVRPPLRLLDWADALGLAVFTASGMERLSGLDLGAGITMVLAAIGACGGGVVRDVIANRAPLLFSGELYVTAALIGAGGYLVAEALLPGAGVPAAILLTAAVRAAGMAFGLRLIHGRGARR